MGSAFLFDNNQLCDNVFVYMENITYKSTVNFTGRNGTFKQTGIAISAMPSDKVITLQPITSKNCLGNAAMDIPFDAVADVIAALSALVKK
jgi:hypothetical protein